MKRLLFLLTFVYSVYLHAQQLMYQKTYGTALQDGCLWSEPTNDGGTILAGYTVVSSYWNMELVKLSSTGVIQWSATYGASYDDYAICVRQTTDNGFIAIGTNNIQDIILFKTDANGILQWSKTLGGIGVDRGRDNGQLKQFLQSRPMVNQDRFTWQRSVDKNIHRKSRLLFGGRKTNS